MAGLSRTSVANSSLMIGATPVLVALLSALLGIERIGRLHWIGAALSLGGIYLVVGQGFALGSHGALGDLLMFVAVCCWAIYTIGARPLMIRHSPVGVTGMSMMVGTLMYLPLAWPSLRQVDWSRRQPRDLGLDDLLGGVRAVRLVHDLVHRHPPARRRPDLDLLELRPDRRDDHRRHRPARAVRSPKVLGAAAVLAGVALTRLGAQRTVTTPPAPRRRVVGKQLSAITCQLAALSEAADPRARFQLPAARRAGSGTFEPRNPLNAHLSNRRTSNRPLQ